ncbi:expressed unknown protein [Seminavis robusta]|uniref:Uncharacterized protein n=1 Tax=Seminavis robusta TaxID=568900 RepID=A0A9N8DKE8_9STRA|nr:expressed unknown protein [Seminavis robusta]|eukprot:Sro192_g082510.1 n/a (146) ;mRNA; r:51497-51934
MSICRWESCTSTGNNTHSTGASSRSTSSASKNSSSSPNNNKLPKRPTRRGHDLPMRLPCRTCSQEDLEEIMLLPKLELWSRSTSKQRGGPASTGTTMHSSTSDRGPTMSSRKHHQKSQTKKSNRRSRTRSPPIQTKKRQIYSKMA